MKWGSPHLLQWLWLAVPLAWFLYYLLRRRERTLTRLADARILPVLIPGRLWPRLRARLILWLSAFLLCLLALARPQWGFHWDEVKRRSLDILVVLDTSRSMLAEDIKPNRMQQAKWGIRDLVKLLKGDRIGLITFAGSSFLQCPLTIDYAAFLMTLEDVYVGIIPRGGTSLYAALRTAVDSFEEEKRTDADRVVILVTDGEDHEGKLPDVLADLKENNIKVYAVGIGTEEGELIPAEGGEGGAFFKNREGNVVKTALQESVLESFALATGGLYVRAAASDFGLERIINQGLSRLKRDEKESRMVKTNEDRYAWFVGAALLLLAVEAVLSETQRRRGQVAA